MPVPLWGAAGLATAAYLAINLVPLSFVYVATTAIPFAILIGATAQADIDRSASLLRNRHLVRLGEWSYAFYLVHLIVIRVAVELAERSGLAGLLHATVERPLERRLRDRPRASAQA